MFTRRTNGMDPINSLRDEMNKLFGEFFQTSPYETRLNWRTPGTFPAINIWEDEDNILFEAEVPGLTMNDIELFVVGNELTVKGERNEERDERKTYHRRERGIGSFSRVIHLPVDINADKVEAVLKNGVLTVTLPKAETAKPRKVEVKALGK
jgi:HSP20 family protein